MDPRAVPERSWRIAWTGRLRRRRTLIVIALLVLVAMRVALPPGAAVPPGEKRVDAVRVSLGDVEIDREQGRLAVSVSLAAGSRA